MNHGFVCNLVNIIPPLVNFNETRYPSMFQKLNYLIPQKVFIKHLEESTLFSPHKITFQTIELKNFNALFYLTQSAASFLETKQALTKSRYVLLMRNGKIVHWFVDFRINEDEMLGHLIVNLDNFDQLNRKWITDRAKVGLYGAAGLMAGWLVYCTTYSAIRSMYDVWDEYQQALNRISEMRWKINEIYSKTNQIINQLDNPLCLKGNRYRN